MFEDEGSLNAFVASATATGTHRWSRRLSGTAVNTISSCQAIAVDGSGNVTTAGALEGATDFGAGTVTSAGSSDAFVASYGPTGTPRWSRVFGGSQSDGADAVATDANGNIVVGGSFRNTVDFGTGPVTSTNLFDGFVVILEGGTGVTRFARHLGALGAVKGVKADSMGNALATGTVDGAANFGTGALAPLGMSDIFVAGFDKATGAARFAKRYGGSDFDAGRALAVTSGGAMVVSGGFIGTADLGRGPINGGAMETAFVMLIAP